MSHQLENYNSYEWENFSVCYLLPKEKRKKKYWLLKTQLDFLKEEEKLMVLKAKYF